MGQWNISERKKIKMTNSRAYHPQSWGTFKRSHRALRKKINYDLVKQSRKGVNSVKNLLEYSKCLNNDKREELSWRSVFEVYYGRKPNELVKFGVSVNREKEFNLQKVIQALENLTYERQKLADEKRKKAKRKSLTRKSMIGQLSNTRWEVIARNIRKDKNRLSDMKR